MASDIRFAALVSALVMLPFAVLEAIHTTFTRQNAPGLLLLFLILWLVPTVFLAIARSVVRSVRAGNAFMAHPIALGLKVAMVLVLALLWGGMFADQLPCFLGVPNCD